MVEFDWSVVEKVGIGGLGVVALFVIFRLTLLFIQQWNESTKALNRNSDAYNKLAEIFENSSNQQKQFQKEQMEFQRQQMEFQKEMLLLTKDTNTKVTALHDKLIKGGD